MIITLTIQEAQEMLRGYIRRGPDGSLFDSATVQIAPDELPNVVEPRDIAPGHNPDELTAAQVIAPSEPRTRPATTSNTRSRKPDHTMTTKEMEAVFDKHNELYLEGAASFQENCDQEFA